MSILVDEETRIVVMGITGKEGSFHTRQMLNYGSVVAAGVTPGKKDRPLKGFLFSTPFRKPSNTKASMPRASSFPSGCR